MTDKMTDEEYFSKKTQKEYITSSQLRTYLECPARFKAEIEGKYKKETTQAMLLGHFIEKALTGGLDEFIEEYHDSIYKKRGDGLLKPFKEAYDLAQELKKDKALVKLLTGDTQKVLFGEIRGHKVMCKLDVLNDDIIDLKYVADFSGKYDANELVYKQWWEKFRYDLQGALYHTISRQNGIIKPFKLVALTKQVPADKALIEFSNETLDKNKLLIHDIIDEVAELKASKDAKPYGCGHCDYCRSVKNFSNIKKEIV